MSPGDLDRRVLRLARTRGHSRWAERVIGAYSRTGEQAAVWLGVGALGYATSSDRGRRAAWARGVRIVAVSYALNYAVIAFALSRPYLGVHYPADVLAGALLGTAVAEAWPA